MKKMKMFFAAAALTLVTVGVFAGKSKFFTSYQAYVLVSSTEIVPISPANLSSEVIGDLNTTTSGANVVTATAGTQSGLIVFYNTTGTPAFASYAYTTAF